MLETKPKVDPTKTQPTQIGSKQNPAVNIFMLNDKEAKVVRLGVVIPCIDTLLLEIERGS